MMGIMLANDDSDMVIDTQVGITARLKHLICWKLSAKINFMYISFHIF